MQSVTDFRYNFQVNNLVESYSDVSFQNIKNAILEAAQYQSEWERKLPARWITFERALMLKKGEGVKVMTLKEIQELNRISKTPVPENELPAFLKYYTYIHTYINILVLHQTPDSYNIYIVRVEHT